MADDSGSAIAENVLPRLGLKLADKAFNFIPTWSEIGSTLGLESGATAGLAGAAAAFGPAAGFLLAAQLLSIIGKADPSSVITGGAQFQGLPDDVTPFGREGQIAQELYAAMLGDRAWYEGGDPSAVGEADVSTGKMVNDGNKQFYSFEGLPYDRQDTSIDSFRQIARGRMGLPVHYEDLHLDDPAYGGALLNRTLAPFDASDQIDWGQWQQELDARNAASGGGEGAVSSLGPHYEDTLSDRAAQYFRMGFTPNMGFAFTGAPETPVEPPAQPKVYEADTTGDTAMSPLAQALAKSRAANTDAIPAMINPNEASILKGLGGTGKLDPSTGMFHFANPTPTDDIWASALSTVQSAQPMSAAVPQSDSGSGLDLSGVDLSRFGIAPGTDPTQASGNYSQQFGYEDSEELGARSDRAVKAAGVDNAYEFSQLGATDQDYALRAAERGDPDGTGGNNDDPFAAEQPYLDNYTGKDKKTAAAWTPPAPPTGGSGVQTTPGFANLDFGTGQSQIQNILAYYNKYGVIPNATGYDPATDTSSAFFDDRPGFGGDNLDPTYALQANLKPEVYVALAEWLGLDPNARDTWLAIENYLGTSRVEQGPVYSGGSYQGLGEPVTYKSALESGIVRLGSGPNAIDVSLDDVLAGNFPNYNSINLALSAGYDPQGDYGTMNTIDAARQLMQMYPELASMMPNSGEYNALRKPIEQAQPGFNAQVANNIKAQLAQGRQVPDVPIGATSLDQIMRNSSGGNLTGPPIAGGGGSVAGDMANARFIDSSNFSTNDAIRIIPGWGGSNLQEYPGGIFLSDVGGKLVLQPNGLFKDEYGLYRDPDTAAIVDANGKPIITQYNAHIGPSYDIEKVFGPGAKDIRRARDLAASGGASNEPLYTGNAGAVGSGSGTGGGSGTGSGSGSGSGDGSGSGGTPANALDALLAAFPAGYERTALSDLLDDPFIERILSEGVASAGDTLSRARASGQLSDIGYNTAYGQLTGSASAEARSRLNELSGGMLGGYRQNIRDIIADAVDYASTAPKSFKIDPYKQSIEALINQVSQNYYGDLLRKIGGPLFDTASLINAGGMAQSPISSGPSGGGVF